MRAIDTNIVLRFITNDDADQSLRSHDLISAGGLFVPVTVLLETEWVLRSSYRFDRLCVVGALRRFVTLPGLQVQHGAEVSRALDYAAGGMELADALHVALSANCTDFVSFDGPLSRKASALGAMHVVEP